MISHSLRQTLKSLGWRGTIAHMLPNYKQHAFKRDGCKPPNTIEDQLVHADISNVSRKYNHVTCLDKRKLIMQDWADKLDIVSTGYY
ncbi:MAG: hypothetical protein ACSLEM_04570 [Candidatus Malihini olakiniferum]